MKKTLQDWLSWQESLHFSAIDLGLDRIQSVAKRLDLLNIDFPIITVAGTNGKGSTVALLNAMLDAEGYTVGAYTSPHILHYNERIALNSQPAADDAICAAFAAIDAVREGVSLTYFEFGTLAAMWLFRREKVDIALLEVGLGGRLDAANLWNADVAIVTSIGIDHVDWLGDDREIIGREKAGIARREKALICGDPQPPQSISKVAAETGAHYLQWGKDFSLQSLGVPAELPVSAEAGTVSDDAGSADANLSDPTRFAVYLQQDNQRVSWLNLPKPALAGDVQQQNAACALVALHQLRDSLPVSQAAIEQGLLQVTLPGRLQKISSTPDVWIDVAHNPHAAQQLSAWLQKNPTDGKTYVLFSILSDKDISGVLTALSVAVDEWHIFPLDDGRAMQVADIQEALHQQSIKASTAYNGLVSAWTALKPRLKSTDRVVAFGSFLVVSSVLRDLS